MNSLLVLDISLLSHINLIIGAFFFSFSGAYIQELLSIYRGVQKHPKLYKVIIGTAIGAMLYIYIFEKYIGNLGVATTTIINTFSGSVGYEIYNRCNTLEGIKKLATDINDIITSFLGIDSILKGKKEKSEKDAKKENPRD